MAVFLGNCPVYTKMADKEMVTQGHSSWSPQFGGGVKTLQTLIKVYKDRSIQRYFLIFLQMIAVLSQWCTSFFSLD